MFSDLLSVTVEPSLTRVLSRKLGCTACGISGIVTRGCHLLRIGRQQQLKLITTPKAAVKDSTCNSCWITPSAETRGSWNLWEKGKRVKYAKTLKFASLCFFCDLWISKVWLLSGSAVRFSASVLGGLPSCCYEGWPEPTVRQGQGTVKFSYAWQLYEWHIKA